MTLAAPVLVKLIATGWPMGGLVDPAGALATITLPGVRVGWPGLAEVRAMPPAWAAPSADATLEVMVTKLG